MSAEVVKTFVEIKLAERDDFLKIKETLTRLGIAAKSSGTLYQSCHILHKQGRYYIVHFKEMFALDGKPSNFLDEDRQRRNRIAWLIAQWNLAELVTSIDEADCIPLSKLTIIPYSKKGDWNLVAKYQIGK